ncbi:FAD-dependent oxidoreductase [bacterium]|nr:FAD-dependent oxidoreductase [bacterium]
MKRRDFMKTSALSGSLMLATTRQGSAKANTMRIPAEEVPIIEEADICVLGGSCTGVFAAIRAARLGAKVVIIEKQNCFGGTATSSMVNVWHSLKDTEHKQNIIAGLTLETMERLKKRNAVRFVENNSSRGFDFNSAELKIELDEMVLEHNIQPHLHTAFSQPVVVDGKLIGVIVESKSGRGVIKARQFIDATGDGDLCHRLGLPSYTSNHLQPPTTCARLENWHFPKEYSVNKTLNEHRDDYNLPEGFAWGTRVPGSDIYMLAGTRVYGADCSSARDLTHAEIEGRRQVRAIMDIVRQTAPEANISLQALPQQIGIRETRHIQCQYQLTGDDVLLGKRFDDAIANGSYRVDIHHQDKPGITFRYLDGTEHYSRPGYPRKVGRWREKTETNPTFYQIPLRSIIPGKFDNLILAGRMLDADIVAFSAVRVMVNMNQTGEAAGVTAFQALDGNKAIKDVPARSVREMLKNGGGIVL